MSAIAIAPTQMYRLGEFHSFLAAGVEFIYLVPGGSIFALEGVAKDLFALLKGGELPGDVLIARLLAQPLRRPLLNSRK